ncbi:MAG: hypothetical protein QHC40_02890 [Sphingobium sp.]|nr:hypothetical protein [Sphingobium sp.]
MNETLVEIRPLDRLLSAYAGRDAARHWLVWAYDARLAQVVRTTTEPLIGQMRLAWWQDVLTDENGAKGRGEPLLAAMRAAGVAGHPGLDSMLDGWEALIGGEAPDPAALRTFGVGRGGGMFRALAGADEGHGEALEQAGALWALWDLSGHVGSRAEVEAAVEAAREFLGGAPTWDWPRRWKPMRLAAELARDDITRGQAAPRTLTPRLYARLLRLALVGR